MISGYKQYQTGRKYMAKMGDWRNDKDEEIELDGIGGVNIMVKADVHRSGKGFLQSIFNQVANTIQASISPATLSRTRPRPRASRRWPRELATKYTVSRTTSSGTWTPKKRATYRTLTLRLGQPTIFSFWLTIIALVVICHLPALGVFFFFSLFLGWFFFIARSKEEKGD